MSKLVANPLHSIDIGQFDLNFFVQHEIDGGLEDNVNVVVDGITYTDVFWIEASDGVDHLELNAGGPNIAVDSVGNVTGGTVTGLALYDYGFSTSEFAWLWSGVSVSAMSIVQAAQTPSTSDDLALLISLLEGDDVITLSDQADNFTTFAGNDIIDGGRGADILDGGSGNDVFLVDGVDIGDQFQGNTGTDTLKLMPFSDPLSGPPTRLPPSTPGSMGSYHLYRAAVSSIERIDFNSSAGFSTQALTVSSQFTSGAGFAPALELVGGPGQDTMVIGAAVAGDYTMPTFTKTNWTTDISASGLSDLVLLTAIGSGDYILRATDVHDGIEILQGNSGNDMLLGGSSQDALIASGGNDQLLAGGGNDIFSVLASVGPSQPISTFSGSFFDGGAGMDTMAVTGNVHFMGSVASVETIRLLSIMGPSPSPAIVPYLGQSTVTMDQAIAEQFGSSITLEGVGTFILSMENTNYSAAGIQFASGADVDFRILGTNGHDAIVGSGGADTLFGGFGNDIIDGGLGIDTVEYSVSRSQANATRNLDGTLSIDVGTDGIDTVSNVELFEFSDGTFGSRRFTGSADLLVTDFAVGAGGWVSQDVYPRHIADMNGDGYSDIVGFGHAGVLVSFGAADGSFSGASVVVSNFGQTAGWASDNQYHRELADLNGDGRDDIIGFGIAGTLVSLAKADGTFDNPFTGISDFGEFQGWASQDGFARAVGDVNGDGKADIVGFGFAGTLVALGNGDGTFQTVMTGVANFGVDQGWTSDNQFHRELADVNGDGFDDILGFGYAGTWVGLSNGDGTFDDPFLGVADFGQNQGWQSQDGFARATGDINNDGYADIAGFGFAGTLIAYGNANGAFSAAAVELDDFGVNQGWTSDATFHRTIADINHDGLNDIVGFGQAGVLAGMNHELLI